MTELAQFQDKLMNVAKAILSPESGWTGQADGTSLVRRAGTFTQQLDIIAERHRSGILPLPRLCLIDEGVNECFLELSQNRHQHLVGSNAAILMQHQIGNLSPSLGSRTEIHQILAEGEQQRDYEATLSHHLRTVVVPFLEDYNSVGRLIDGTLMLDPRLPRDRRFALLMAVAASAIGRFADGVAILDRTFHRTASKREVASLRELMIARGELDD